MKRNLYLVRCSTQRSNPFKMFFYNLFSGLAAIPVIYIEIFTRKNFGSRYFSLAMALLMAFILMVIPIVTTYISSLGSFHDPSILDFLSHYLTWYLFIAYFVYICFKREKEIGRITGIFDFDKYSLSHGELDPRIRNFKYKGIVYDIRTVETIIEPGLFFLIGLVLAILGQRIGLVIFISSICYSINYLYAYKLGDDFIQDMIDTRIANEQTVKVMVDGLESGDTKGFQMYTGTPNNHKLRQEIAADIIDEELPVYAV